MPRPSNEGSHKKAEEWLTENLPAAVTHNMHKANKAEMPRELRAEIKRILKIKALPNDVAAEIMQILSKVRATAHIQVTSTSQRRAILETFSRYIYTMEDDVQAPPEILKALAYPADIALAPIALDPAYASTWKKLSQGLYVPKNEKRLLSRALKMEANKKTYIANGRPDMDHEVIAEATARLAQIYTDLTGMPPSLYRTKERTSLCGRFIKAIITYSLTKQANSPKNKNIKSLKYIGIALEKIVKARKNHPK